MGIFHINKVMVDETCACVCLCVNGVAILNLFDSVNSVATLKRVFACGIRVTVTVQSTQSPLRPARLSESHNSLDREIRHCTPVNVRVGRLCK